MVKDEEIFVRMVSHADSALVFESRCWTESENYFNLKFDLFLFVPIEGIDFPLI